jgi:hypothetical protein
MTRCAPQAVADAGRAPGKTLAVDGQRFRSAPHLIAGDPADSLEHGLDAAYTGPGPRCRTRASAALSWVTQVATPCVSNPATIRYSPLRRACGEIHVQAAREDRGAEHAEHKQGDDSRGCSPAARRAPGDVQRSCGRATKYSGKGVLHDLRRRDAGLRCT